MITRHSTNVPNFYDLTQRELVVELADFWAQRLEGLHSEEASAFCGLSGLVCNRRLGRKGGKP